MSVDVENLVPHTIRAWVTVILLAFLSYLLYYGLVFNNLVKVYKDQLFATVPCGEYSESSLSRSLNVTVYYPKHLASFGYRWLYVTMRNSSGKLIKDVKVWFSATPNREAGEDVSHNSVLIFPYLYKDKNRLSRSIQFAEIPPDGVVSGRLPVLAPLGEVVTGTLYIAGEVVTDTLHSARSGTAELAGVYSSRSALLNLGSNEWDVDTYRSLSHGLIEFVLLPPWANGFLILAILVITGLQDSREPEEHVLSLEEWFWSLLRLAIRVVGSISAVALFVWGFLFAGPFGPTTLWGFAAASLIVGIACWFLHPKVTERFRTVYRSNNHRRIKLVE